MATAHTAGWELQYLSVMESHPLNRSTLHAPWPKTRASLQAHAHGRQDLHGSVRTVLFFSRPHAPVRDNVAAAGRTPGYLKQQMHHAGTCVFQDHKYGTGIVT